MPNLNVRSGVVTIFSDKHIDQMYHSISARLKKWYHENYQYNDIKKMITRCALKNEEIYEGYAAYDNETGIIRKFHRSASMTYIQNNARNVNYLLDVGSGKISDINTWKYANIRHVVGVEPSHASVLKARERIKKERAYNIDVVEGYGDEDWNNPKYNIVTKNKYDTITFNFTIHYMIKNIDQLMKNISDVSKQGTKIIVFCLDGKSIYDVLKQSGKLEVVINNDPIWGIYQYNQKANEQTMPDIFEIMAYFRGTYGVQNGSIEYLVNTDKLIDTFKHNGFRLLESRKFDTIRNKNSEKMSKIQLTVSKYHMVIIFQKI